MDLKPTTNYPEVYDSKVLNPIIQTGTGGETRLFETKQGGKRSSKQGGKKKSKIHLSKRLRKSNKRNNRKTSYKK